MIRFRWECDRAFTRTLQTQVRQNVTKPNGSHFQVTDLQYILL